MYQKTELIILYLLKSCSPKKWVALHEKLTNITVQRVFLTSLSAAPFIGGIAPKGPEYDIISNTSKHTNKERSKQTCFDKQNMSSFLSLPFLFVKRSTFET